MRINIAARAVGLAQEALDQSLAYSRERRAFNRSISDFQVIQIKLATMATKVQAARLMTYGAASNADGGERVDIEAGMAKCVASEVAVENALEAMRMHGGMGYSTELGIELIYRDAPLIAIGEGTNDIQLVVIARGLLDGRIAIGK